MPRGPNPAHLPRYLGDLRGPIRGCGVGGSLLSRLARKPALFRAVKPGRAIISSPGLIAASETPASPPDRGFFCRSPVFLAMARAVSWGLFRRDRARLQATVSKIGGTTSEEGLSSATSMLITLALCGQRLRS